MADRLITILGGRHHGQTKSVSADLRPNDIVRFPMFETAQASLVELLRDAPGSCVGVSHTYEVFEYRLCRFGLQDGRERWLGVPALVERGREFDHILELALSTAITSAQPADDVETETAARDWLAHLPQAHRR